MAAFGIDQDALIKQFAEATAQQGEALRKATADATLKALQGRELTLANIRKVLKTITEAAGAGAAKNPLPAVDLEVLLTKGMEGMDAALVKAVEANRRALQQFVDQGIELRQTQLKKALTDLEKMEDVLFSSVGKAVADAAQAVQGPWASALAGLKDKGSATGGTATAALQQLTDRARDASRQGRALAQSGVDAWLNHYAALASGVLIGLSDSLEPAASTATAAAKKPAARARGT